MKSILESNKLMIDSRSLRSQGVSYFTSNLLDKRQKLNIFDNKTPSSLRPTLLVFTTCTIVNTSTPPIEKRKGII